MRGSTGASSTAVLGRRKVDCMPARLAMDRKKPACGADGLAVEGGGGAKSPPKTVVELGACIEK